MAEQEKQNNNSQASIVLVNEQLPSQLSVIPLHTKPIFPGLYTPIVVPQGRHTETVTEALENNNGFIGLNLISDPEYSDENDVTLETLHKTGVVAKIFKKLNLPDGGMNVLVSSIHRYKILRYLSLNPIVRVEPLYFPEDTSEQDEVEEMERKAYTRALISEVKQISEDNPLFTEEMRLTMINVDEPGKLADLITSMINADREKQQEILETFNIKERLQKALTLVEKEKEIVKIQQKIQNNINETIQKQQREYFLKEQLKEIKKELGVEVDEKTKELNRFKEMLENLSLTEEVKTRIEEEIEKFSLMDTHSPEFSITRNYIETVLTLPWNTASEETIDLDKSRKILDRDHYGLDDVKKRIIEFLAVRILKPDTKASIICLVGPPGVGKTSMGKSIAAALSREFFRFSLGGMRDEAEIKGHRRTYIGAMPGKIIQALKIVKTNNPVIMLDEIDKLGVSFQGDPSSALLEVLDPEQNVMFRDHYLDLPFDLSNVLFITTANTTDTIPRPLLDRMEVIRLSGYILEEKLKIATKYIIPRQRERHGLTASNLSITKKALTSIVKNYAKEAGLRNFERNVEKLCRKVATNVVDEGKKTKVKIDEEMLEEYLGKPIFDDDLTKKATKPGIAIGLAWTELGGKTLTIECLAVASAKAKGNLNLTGNMGDVMTESARIAFSYVRSVANEYAVDEAYFDEHFFHLHIPAGATPKDGPSAGITMATAIMSLAREKTIKQNVAMTGELSLTGKVLPIGGLKEKVIAAKRLGFIKRIIVPKANEKDLEEIPDYIKKGVAFTFVEDMREVIDAVF